LARLSEHVRKIRWNTGESRGQPVLPACHETVQQSPRRLLDAGIVRCECLASLLDEVRVHVMARCIADAEDVSIGFIVCADAKALHASCDRFVAQLLLASPIDLLLISCWVAEMCVDLFVAEPGTVAGFPFQAAHHAEFGGTPAGHVVAAFFELDHCGTAVAALPAFFLDRLHETLCFRIFGTVAGGVHFAVTYSAHARAATFAFSYLAAALNGNVGGFDPFATAAGGTVKSVLRLVLGEFAIPGLFELLIEKLVHVLEVNMLVCTTPWWHVSGIGDGQLEDAFEAGVAHSMCAWEFGGSGYTHFIVTACQAGDFAFLYRRFWREKSSKYACRLFLGLRCGRFCCAELGRGTCRGCASLDGRAFALWYSGRALT